MKQIFNKKGLLNTVALFGALYCIFASFLMSVSPAFLIRRTPHEYLMDVIYGGVWSMEFGIAAILLLFWRFKRFNSLAKKLGISLLVIAILVQIFNIVNTLFMILT